MKTYMYEIYAPLLLSQPWMSTWSLSPKIHSTLFLNLHWGPRARSGIVLTHLLGFRGFPREGTGDPLQYSCLENPMDGGAWWAAVHGVAKSRTLLSDFTFTFHFHALEKEMATHSSVLAWRIPGSMETWWAATCGVAQSRTRLKRLSSRSSSRGFPGGTSGKEPTCQCRRQKRHGFSPWVWKIPWRRAWQPTPVFLPREFHNQRSLAALLRGVTQSWTQLKWFKPACRKLKILVGWRRQIGGFQMFLELNEIYSL